MTREFTGVRQHQREWAESAQSPRLRRGTPESSGARDRREYEELEPESERVSGDCGGRAEEDGIGVRPQSDRCREGTRSLQGVHP